MRLLLDTHVALWAVSNDPKLSRRARELVEDASNIVSVSVVSLWEVAIKQMLRSRRNAANALPLTLAQASSAFARAGFEIVDLSPRHVTALSALPLIHADPFDRILVAQAIAESMRLVTSDHRLPAYGDTVIAA